MRAASVSCLAVPWKSRLGAPRLLPPLDLSPPRGRVRSFRCGARLARGGAPAEEGGGPSPPTPAIARAKPAAAATRRRASLPKSDRCSTCKPSINAAGVQSPAVRFASIGRACCTGLHALGSSPIPPLSGVPCTPRKRLHLAYSPLAIRSRTKHAHSSQRTPRPTTSICRALRPRHKGQHFCIGSTGICELPTCANPSPSRGTVYSL